MAPRNRHRHSPAITDAMNDAGTSTDGDDRKVSPSNNGKDNNSMGTNDDQINHSINKLKRAAVTVLSAATVKAKLLANQEEDQIRQLISFIIEKQLHKLEAKLSLFTDVETVIMRMREQTERARHRLMHERAQIIAARLGLPAPARGNPLPLPTNKFTPGYGTAGSNPASIASQKAPPTRRP